ncbi:MAG: class IV adenylate cyclase [Phycisphaerales bacterium]
MHNVEYKAELRDLPLARAIAKQVGAKLAATLDQTDTYFRVTTGRLKKREAIKPGHAPEPVQFIFYDRADIVRPKLSHYTLYTEEEARERYGERPLPTDIVVHKRRELWLLDATRIHFDIVEKLGNFIEFEVPVHPKSSVTAARDKTEELRKAFAPALGEAVALSYRDLLAEDRSD